MFRGLVGNDLFMRVQLLAYVLKGMHLVVHLLVRQIIYALVHQPR